jgi:hypothetical protein
MRSLLLEHFKRFPVNAPGGLLIMKDDTRYVELLKSWDIDEDVKTVSGVLDVLLEVGSLFVVGPEALREKLRGGTANGGTRGPRNNSNADGRGGATRPSQNDGIGLSVSEVKAYVLRRDDCSSVAMQSLLSTL